MVRICIRILEIPFEWLEFELESLELLSNASNPFRTVRICIQMLRIPFEWFEFFSNGSNLHSNALNPFRMVRNLY